FLSDLPYVHSLAFVRLSRIVSDDVHVSIARQVGDDVFRQPVGEAPRRFFAGDVGERQHRERRPPSDAGGWTRRLKIPGGESEDQCPRRGGGPSIASSGHSGPQSRRFL